MISMIQKCDNYLAARTGHYFQRRIRYRAALQEMIANLSDTDTIIDVGAGWTEFDYCLRVEAGWRGRYIPVDGGIDGTDLEEWTPPRLAEWFVCLEVIEHLEAPLRLVDDMRDFATKGAIISTPNPETTDVLAMDATHKTAIHKRDLQRCGFTVYEMSFYGKPNDSLLAVYFA